MSDSTAVSEEAMDNLALNVIEGSKIRDKEEKEKTKPPSKPSSVAVMDFSAQAEARPSTKNDKKCRGKWEDFSRREQKRIEQKCKSPTFSRKPFLAKDQDMATVIADDRRKLLQLGVSAETLGNAMKTVYKIACNKPDKRGSSLVYMFGGKMPEFKSNLGCMTGGVGWCPQGMYEREFCFNGQKLLVFVIAWGGSQRCPFQAEENETYHGYSYGARDVIVKNLHNGKHLTYSTLMPHMIKHHEFFQGPGQHYRVNPSDVTLVLGDLKDSEDYRIPNTIKNVFNEVMSSTDGSGMFSKGIKKEVVRQVDVYTHMLYILNDKEFAAEYIPEEKRSPRAKTMRKGNLELLKIPEDVLPGDKVSAKYKKRATKVYDFDGFLKKDNSTQRHQVLRVS